MANSSKNKGDRFERAVAKWLNDNGHPSVERALGAGRRDDRGDLLGIAGWALQLKCHNKMTLPAWMRDAARNADNAGTDLYCVIHRRRGINYADHEVDDFGDHWVTMPLSVFARWAAS